MNITRTGIGYDIHALAQGEELVLGGVKFPNAEFGTVAHSDGDVLLHAICDALLGAMALPDIGYYFPDTDPQWKGASSIELLRRVGKIVREAGAQILNVDSTIVAEQPKLLPFRDEMRSNVAKTLEIRIENVGLKATTNEGLGPVGNKEGIAVYSVCSLLAEMQI